MATAIFPPRIEIPRRLRALVRARETSLVVLAMAVGVICGVVVLAMSAIVKGLHALFFNLPYGTRLSSVTELDPWLALAVPCAGGLVFGFATQALRRWRSGREVDPIEANALHGGRMSVIGSVIVRAQTVWSSGVGASVGLEAGYTQLSSGLASWLGRAFRLRRRDLRTLVGCGAAARVAAAAIIGYLVVAQVERPDLGIAASTQVGTPDLLIAALIGVLAAAFGIAVMRGVGYCETLFGRLGITPALRPALGGLVVGLLAIVSPQVMSSGHGALHLASILALPLGAIALIFVLKAAASVVSLGSGFRGGLFFASLLLGALGGQLVCAGLGMILPGPLNPQAYAIIGMGALSVSIIGGPLTMTFIALETTGDLWLTAAVLIAVIISAQVTREVFGYSFATWRFHLRGETIRSAADIGWIRDLTVGRMMRRDLQTVPVDTYVSDFRQAFPLGATGQVVAVDEDGRYAGIVFVADAHAKELKESLPVREIVRHRDAFLLPEMTVQHAVAIFDRAETEALAVVDAPATRRVIGLLTEAHALRRYTEESELHRRELLVDA